MALAPARQAGGRGARIADFWRISAVFWLHTGIRIPWGAVHGSRLSVHGSWPAGHRITARCWRDLPAGCRIEGRGSWPAGDGSRFTVAGSRPVFAGWYVWDKERGARRGFINSFNVAMLAS